MRAFANANQDGLVDGTSGGCNTSNMACHLEQELAASLWVGLTEHFATRVLVKTTHLNNMNIVFSCGSLRL